MTRARAFIFAGGFGAGAGFLIALTLWISSFSRYMYVEDLDPAVPPEVFRKLVAFAPAERALLYVSLACVALGLLLMLIGRARRKRGS
ncbi:cell division protein FtsX [Arthrobacter sp. GAS37]